MAGLPRLLATPVARRRAAWWAAFVGIVVLTLGLRVGLDGRAELDAAARAGASGDVRAEIRHLGRAARWRAPVLGHDEQARARLEEIASAAATARDWPLSLDAFRELRRALWSTRAFGRVSDPEALRRADGGIASAMAVGGYDRDVALSELGRDPTPHGLGTGLAALAFLAWLVTMLGFIRHALDENGRVVPRAAVRWGSAVLGMLAVWMALMRHPEWIG